MNISVLMSVYIGTDSTELLNCLQSVSEQSLPPSQVVIVVDGPVKSDVEGVLKSYKERTKYSVDVIRFPENRGLGAALADGLNVCHHDLIARVDTDDINLPVRFEAQHQFLVQSPELSVVGGVLEEAYKTPRGEEVLVRKVPIEWKKIERSARYRNPINHPTAMFRKEHVLKSGNYQPLLWFEDYYLWARMIMNGYKFGNINQVLVRASADRNYFLRRGGLNYLRQEIALTSSLRKIGFHNLFNSIRFLTVRFIFRIMPVKYRSWFYLRTLRKHSKLGS